MEALLEQKAIDAEAQAASLQDRMMKEAAPEVEWIRIPRAQTSREACTGHGYTSYVIEVEVSGGSGQGWKVARRFRDFQVLSRRLDPRAHANGIPPPKVRSHIPLLIPSSQV